jgi:peptidoglycan/LPS O-acetylase OafA/YrhL
VTIFAALYYGFGFILYPKASFEPLNILANMLMLHVDIDVVMWSMKAEVAATPLIILCVWLFRRYGAWTVSTIAVVLFGLAFTGQFTKSIGDDTNLAPIFAFPVGILVHFWGRELAAKLPPWAVTLGAFVSVAIFCACTSFKPTGTWTLLVQCLSAATLVMLIAYRAEAAVFYSFYLLHPLALWSTTWLSVYVIREFPAVPVTLMMVAAFIVSLAIVTPLAFLSWRFVELPAMNKLRAAPASRSALPAASG